MIRDFRRRFWVGLVLTVPILLLSPMIQNWLGISWQIPGQLYWLLGLSTTLFAYGGFPFLKGWWKEMRDWKPGMMTLIGLAISGTDVAAETADIILVESDPRDVVALVRFGRSTFRKMVQNLIWATAYNVVALPLAAGVLYQQGILISPAVGAALMSLSTVIVAINAQSLKWQLRKN